jgi:hypothetical protein
VRGAGISTDDGPRCHRRRGVFASSAVVLRAFFASFFASFFERSSRRRALAAGNTTIFAAAERAQGGRCIVLGCTQGAPEVL